MKHFRLAPPGARIALVLMLLLLAGCFGGGGGILDTNGQQPAGKPAAPVVPDAPEQPRNTLRTSMPALSVLAVGSEFDFVLSGSFSDPLHQASARVLYDSTVVELLDAQRGELIPGDAVCVLRSDLRPGELALRAEDHPGACDTVVPFAFTRLPEGRAAAAQEGELLRLRFRLRGQPRGGQAAVQLLNNQEFLQFRDSAGQRLSFDLETRQDSSEVAH